LSGTTLRDHANVVRRRKWITRLKALEQARR
jgi:hypothetical protein